MDDVDVPYPSAQDLIDDLNLAIYLNNSGGGGGGGDVTIVGATIDVPVDIQNQPIAITGTVGIDDTDPIEVEVTGLPLDVNVVNFDNVDTYALTCGRSQASVNNVWLRRSQNLPLNLTPFVVPFDSKIVAISLSTNSNATWDAEVYRNADVRAGGIPSDANKIAELQVAGANANSVLLDINVDANDEIGVFCRGLGIDRPGVTVFFKRR